ncbi:uncharacterized protein BKA78DRAFT_61713 [Phyllosticta capitalensis]|uniref:uncharacterized protein n=1 Tax=Phyllosticta capitalensis TaxID=121624 RepID=UPI00312F15C5
MSMRAARATFRSSRPSSRNPSTSTSVVSFFFVSPCHELPCSRAHTTLRGFNCCAGAIGMVDRSPHEETILAWHCTIAHFRVGGSIASLGLSSPCDAPIRAPSVGGMRDPGPCLCWSCLCRSTPSLVIRPGSSSRPSTITSIFHNVLYFFIFAEYQSNGLLPRRLPIHRLLDLPRRRSAGSQLCSPAKPVPDPATQWHRQLVPAVCAFASQRQSRREAQD